MQRCIEVIAPLPSCCFRLFAPRQASQSARLALVSQRNLSHTTAPRSQLHQEQSSQSGRIPPFETGSKSALRYDPETWRPRSSVKSETPKRPQEAGVVHGDAAKRDGRGRHKPRDVQSHDGRLPLDPMNMQGVQILIHAGNQIGAKKLAESFKHRLDPRAAEWASFFTDPAHLRGKWLHAAIWLATNNADRLLNFVRETARPGMIPWSWISACLTMEAFSYGTMSKVEADKRAADLLNTMKELSTRDYSDMPCWWNVSRALCPYLDAQGIAELFDLLHEHSFRLTKECWADLSGYLVRQGSLKRAMQAYIKAVTSTGHMTPFIERRYLVPILHAARDLPEGPQHCIWLFKELRTLGKPVTASIVNRLMLRALEDSKVELAIQLYRETFNEICQPDEYTILLLLKAVKQDSTNALSLQEVTAIAQETGLLSTQHLIAAELLHATFKISIETGSHDIWTDIWKLYSQIYDNRPLQQLGLPPPKDYDINKSVRQPSQQVLGIMLSSYLQLRREHDKKDLAATHDLWKQFQTVACEDDSPLAELATTDYAFNMFLYAFAYGPNGLGYAAEVIREMQTPFSEGVSHVKSKPSAISWNIFLLGFNLKGKAALAEKIMKHMESEGIKPDQIAWEQLVHGHAAAQDLDALIEALRRADQEGVLWTEYMTAAVGRYPDQSALRKALRRETQAGAFGRRINNDQEKNEGVGSEATVADVTSPLPALASEDAGVWSDSDGTTDATDDMLQAFPTPEKGRSTAKS